MRKGATDLPVRRSEWEAREEPAILRRSVRCESYISTVLNQFSGLFECHGQRCCAY